MCLHHTCLKCPPFLKRLLAVWAFAWVLFLFNAFRIILTQTKGEAYTPHIDRGGKYLRDSYWGPVTANIDWCETNYAVSPYVAEFFNTLSSLAFVAAGVYGMFQCHYRGAGIKFTFCCVGLTILLDAAQHSFMPRCCAKLKPPTKLPW